MAHKSVAVPQTSYTVHLGDRGRLVLPSRLRKQLRLKTGEEFLLTVEEGGVLQLSTRRQRIKAATGMYAAISPERILSEELIRERREEARRENQE
jgi:AbrB family looped-hinge helix DNA binding protein